MEVPLEAVKQKVLGELLTPAEAIAKLISLKQGGKAEWWKKFDFEIVLGVAKLKCIFCGDHMSAENPSQRASSHFKDLAGGCVKSAPGSKQHKRLKGDGSAGASGDQAISTSASASGSNQAKITAYIAPQAARQQCMEKLKMFFYTNPIALHLIETPSPQVLPCSFLLGSHQLPGEGGQMELSRCCNTQPKAA
jgi:hypothetical protein